MLNKNYKSPVAQLVERVAVGKELQLPREIVVEKSGEFREACPPPHMENGNPEPSPELSLFREGAETRASARTPDGSSIRGKRPTPYPQEIGAGEEIVQAQKKFWEYL